HLDGCGGGDVPSGFDAPVGICGGGDVPSGFASLSTSFFFDTFHSLLSVTSTVIVDPGFSGFSRNSTIHPSSECLLISLKSLSVDTIMYRYGRVPPEM